jgi:hypothetical protein
MTMKRLLYTALVLTLLVGVGTLPGHTAQPQRAEDLMRRKLSHAQKVLEGVALQDFKEIARHADELIEISKQAQWKVLKTPLYENYSGEFRDNATELIKQAKKEDVDGAAKAYVAMTLTCVKCHKHVRDKRMARAD